MELGRMIKEIRLHSFFSQEEFAQVLGVSYATVNRWENGKTKPNIKAMKRLYEFCQNEEIDVDIRKLGVREIVMDK